MLEIVKQSIRNAPCISFRQYFTQYIFAIQDANIDNEITFLLRNNHIDYNFFNRVMSVEVENSND